MSTAAEILVIITSSVLVVFLIIAIVLAIYLIKLTTEIRRITKSAQTAVNGVGATFSKINKLVSPVYVAEVISRVAKKYSSKKGEQGNDKE